MRFKVRLRKILKTQEFDQMVFVDLKPTATSGSTWTATIGLSPQQPTSAYAYLFLDDSGTDFRACDPMHGDRLASPGLAAPRRTR